MKKRNAMKVIGSVAGASVLLAGAAPAEVAANIDVPGGVLQACLQLTGVLKEK